MTTLCIKQHWYVSHGTHPLYLICFNVHSLLHIQFPDNCTSLIGLTPCITHLSLSLPLSESVCVLERVITVKLHRRHRLSPWKEKQRDGEKKTDLHEEQGGRETETQGRERTASCEKEKKIKKKKKNALLLICLYSTSTSQLSDNSCSVHLLHQTGSMSQISGRIAELLQLN